MCWGRDEKTLIRCMTASTTALSSVPSEVRLADREIHLWYATLGDFSRARPRLESTLSQDERRRASQFRAFDAMTGKELWTTSPGFDVGGAAVVYRGASGKQYVVITGPKVIAYALP